MEAVELYCSHGKFNFNTTQAEKNLEPEIFWQFFFMEGNLFK